MRFSRKFPDSRKFGRAENRPKHVLDKLQVKALLPSGIKWNYRAKTDRSPNLCTTIHMIKIVILFHDCRKPATSSSQVVKIMLDHGINDFASNGKSFYRHASILNSKVWFLAATAPFKSMVPLKILLQLRCWIVIYNTGEIQLQAFKIPLKA